MMRQNNDLTLSLISTCLVGALLSWKQSPSLVPVILMTSSSLLLLGLAELYFHWKDRQTDYL
ncbi:hypothetical protein ACVR1G_04675 [Streptococcus dentasini]